MKNYLLTILTILCVFAAYRGNLLSGDVQKSPKLPCEIALHKTSIMTKEPFKDYRIFSCETQVVAGVNFFVSLAKINSNEKVCTILVYGDLSHHYVLALSSNETTDCFILWNLNPQNFNQ